jgi:predicted ATPase
LIEKRGQRAVKKALETVKPYFLNMVNQRLEEESQRLLSCFRQQENKVDALTHYLTLKKYP